MNILELDIDGWYERNRLKYWVVVFLTVGFVVGLPFVIIGLILELTYRHNQRINELYNDEDDIFDEASDEAIDMNLELNNKKDLDNIKRINKKNQFECPKCGSESIETYRHLPFFRKENICTSCEYSWFPKNIIRMSRYICPNCGSHNMKPHAGGVTGVCFCVDCDFVGIPFIEDI